MLDKPNKFSKKEYAFFLNFFADVLGEIQDGRIKFPGNILGEGDPDLVGPAQKITNYLHMVKDGSLTFPNSSDKKAYEAATTVVSHILRVMTEGDAPWAFCCRCKKEKNLNRGETCPEDGVFSCFDCMGITPTPTPSSGTPLRGENNGS